MDDNIQNSITYLFYLHYVHDRNTSVYYQNFEINYSENYANEICDPGKNESLKIVVSKISDNYRFTPEIELGIYLRVYLDLANNINLFYEAHDSINTFSRIAYCLRNAVLQHASLNYYQNTYPPANTLASTIAINKFMDHNFERLKLGRSQMVSMYYLTVKLYGKIKLRKYENNALVKNLTLNVGEKLEDYDLNYEGKFRSFDRMISVYSLF